jgi:hypothetical protein
MAERDANGHEVGREASRSLGAAGCSVCFANVSSLFAVGCGESDDESGDDSSDS